jgi:septum formation protein
MLALFSLPRLSNSFHFMTSSGSRYAKGHVSTGLEGFSSPEFSAKFSVPDPVNVDVERNRARKLILGSGSSSRRMILTNAGYEFDVVKADLDERAIGDRSKGDVENTKKLVSLLANSKADAIMKILKDPAHANADQYSVFAGRPLLTADQVVICNDQVLEKPLNEQEARAFMGMYGDHPCSTVGCIALTDTATGKRVSAVDVATIHFNPIAESVMDQLISEGVVFHCAGGLMIENPLVLPFIERVEGSEESVMGISSVLLDSLFNELY